jgi:hypothetical protein
MLCDIYSDILWMCIVTFWCFVLDLKYIYTVVLILLAACVSLNEKWGIKFAFHPDEHDHCVVRVEAVRRPRPDTPTDLMSHIVRVAVPFIMLALCVDVAPQLFRTLFLILVFPAWFLAHWSMAVALAQCVPRAPIDIADDAEDV